VHGLAARWQVFGPLIPALSARWHLYAPDLRGHGGSGWASPRYELNDFVDDVLALLDQRVDKPTLVYGHSIGGWLALAAAAARPDAVRAVVVGDTAIRPTGIDPDFAVSYLVKMPVSMRSLAKSLNQLDPEVMAHFRQGGKGLDFDPDVVLPKVKCPVLLLQANPALGGLMTDADVDRALTLLADGTHVRFDGLGHGLHVEDAGAVLDVVLPFLDAA
jgi:pimeloyl-ACP methyl ester carboxylesterase